MNQRLGQFDLVEQVGAGGMGVVYRAYDTRLDRYVAIKVLPPGLLEDTTSRRRFRKEALALSKLNHPNIATVHDFSTEGDTDFLVMELVPGPTLDEKLASGPLPEHEIVGLGSQMAEALAAAHEHGVIHRDLKPSNLKVTPQGRLKTLDFGLAKTIHVDPDGQTQSMVDAPATAGTLPYMAPEQLRNELLDERTDIWAAGAVLYEMATGQRPFAASTPAALAGEILHAPLRPPSQLRPDLSPQLEQIILRCLQRNPTDRFLSAKALAAELAAGVAPVARQPARTRLRVMAAVVVLVALAGAAFWLASFRNSVQGTLRPGDRVAVMPLLNLSGDVNEQYLAEGVTDALITELARVERLNVIARGAVARVQRQGKTPVEVARDLDAKAFLEGGIQRVASRVRISARLVQTSTNVHVWAESYEGDLADILKLQRQIASAVASAVAGTARVSAGAGRQVDPAAHEAYLRGRFFWAKRTVDDLKKAVAYFEQATQKDPAYAAAYSGIADSYVSLYDYGHLSAADVSAQIRVAARRALELDPKSPEAHASLGHLALHDWDWAQAEKEFQEAIAIDPSYVTAYHWYALCLTAVGRTDEAVAAMRQALRLDPFSLRINADFGMALLAAGKHDEAIEQERKTLELRPGFGTALWIEGMALQQKRMLPEAIEKYQQALAATPGNANVLAALGNALGEAGRTAEARRTLGELHAAARKGQVSSFFFALVHVGLGETREALDWLEKAYEERSGSIRYLKVEPRLNRLRAEPRFRELMGRVGLS